MNVSDSENLYRLGLPTLSHFIVQLTEFFNLNFDGMQQLTVVNEGNDLPKFWQIISFSGAGKISGLNVRQPIGVLIATTMNRVKIGGL